MGLCNGRNCCSSLTLRCSKTVVQLLKQNALLSFARVDSWWWSQAISGVQKFAIKARRYGRCAPLLWAVRPLHPHVHYRCDTVCAATFNTRERWTGGQECSGGPLVRKKTDSAKPSTKFSADELPALLPKKSSAFGRLRPRCLAPGTTAARGCMRVLFFGLGLREFFSLAGSGPRPVGDDVGQMFHGNSACEFVISWDEPAVRKRTQP